MRAAQNSGPLRRLLEGYPAPEREPTRRLAAFWGAFIGVGLSFAAGWWVGGLRLDFKPGWWRA